MQVQIEELLNTQRETGGSAEELNGLAPLEDDPLEKVFGPDKNGRVRGMGYGVTPKMFKKGNLQVIQENEDLKERNKKLEDKVRNSNKKIAKFP